MERRIVYRNSDGVKRTSISDDQNPEELKVFTEVQMDEVLEGIKRARESQPAKSDMRHLARVPMTVVEQSIHEQWDDNDWKRWLNDPDNAHFRVWQGRV